jgi:hypothetical protein
LIMLGDVNVLDILVYESRVLEASARESFLTHITQYEAGKITRSKPHKIIYPLVSCVHLAKNCNYSIRSKEVLKRFIIKIVSQSSLYHFIQAKKGSEKSDTSVSF